MHLEILSNEQKELFPFLSLFKKEYFLVGGTALALHIGHRQSIDFDLFKEKAIRKSIIFKRLVEAKIPYQTTFSDYNQINLNIRKVKVTFFQFPFKVPQNDWLKNVIKMPDLLTLAAMKAFAMGRRAKWKDYVDLYFLIKYFYSIEEICECANKLFENQFVKKQFLAQIGYFKGIDYQEEVRFLIKNPPSVKEVEGFLTEVSLSDL